MLALWSDIGTDTADAIAAWRSKTLDSTASDRSRRLWPLGWDAALRVPSYDRAWRAPRGAPLVARSVFVIHADERTTARRGTQEGRPLPFIGA